MKLTRLSLLTLAVAALGITFPARASGDHGSHSGHKAQPAAAAEMTDGEVRKVDADNLKLTLKHADIKSLDMPAMTMVFGVKDKALLAKLKAGDKVKFKAVNDGGKYMVTELQVVH